MTKVYVVQRRSYEYDDSTYTASEGGSAVRAYTSLAAAEQATIDMMVEGFKEGDIEYLAESSSFNFDTDVFELLAGRGYEMRDGYLRWDDARDISESIKYGAFTDEDLRKIARGLNKYSATYYVEKVEVD